MAEPISLASGLITLTGFAFKSSIALHETVRGFQNHPKRVRDLHDELEALSGVLSALQDTINTTNDLDLSALHLPLLRCGKACKEFEQEILKCSSRSNSSRTSFRDWAKLRYMGDDIASFTQLLAGYKATINIALTDATLRYSSTTAAGLEGYRQLLKTATDDIEAHLENMNEKLESMLTRAATETGSDTGELQIIQDERKSAQKCLDICSQLSAHIDQIQLENRQSRGSNKSASPDMPEEWLNDGLQECQDNLTSTAAKLERLLRSRLDQMIKQAAGSMTRENRAEFDRVREEWETARQSVDLYAKANIRLKENVSVINNHAIGDAVQIMVSTDGKTLHGSNDGRGWRTRQIGGHLNDASVQQLSRDIFGPHSHNLAADSPSRRSSSVAADNVPISEFDGRYGHGFKLTSKSSQGNT